AENAPAKAVDDADHRIEAIQESPLLRYHRAGEADRRNIHAKLHNERDDVTEIAVFNIQCSNEQRRPKTGEHGQNYEAGQQQQLPARNESIDGHQHAEHDEVDTKIDQRHHSARDRNHDAGEIDLADEIGVADKAVRGLA